MEHTPSQPGYSATVVVKFVSAHAAHPPGRTHAALYLPGFGKKGRHDQDTGGYDSPSLEESEHRKLAPLDPAVRTGWCPGAQVTLRWSVPRGGFGGAGLAHLAHKSGVGRNRGQ